MGAKPPPPLTLDDACLTLACKTPVPGLTAEPTGTTAKNLPVGPEHSSAHVLA